ncbi:MAG: plastocyanin/azurin family copper-binding protein [Pseudomonadota bacterium]
MKHLVAALLALAVAAPAWAAEHEIIQQNKKFSAKEITVKKGDTVVFKNADPFVHNVYSQTPGMEFDLQQQQPGGSSPVKFDKVGEADIRCAIHPTMKMTVKVTE